jgi:hypothetical protein
MRPFLFFILSSILIHFLYISSFHPRYESDFADSSCRAFAHAFAAKPAFGEINPGKVIFNGDCFEGTYLLAFCAGYAGYATSTTCNATLVAIDAGYKDAAAFWSLAAQLDKPLWAGFDASIAGTATVFAYFGQACHGIDG